MYHEISYLRLEKKVLVFVDRLGAQCHKIILCAIYLCVSKFFGKITLAWKDKIELA